MSLYVLDSFALLAHYRNEPAAKRVRQLISSSAHQHWMSVINLGEVYYKTIREKGLNKAQDVLVSVFELPITLVAAELDLTISAAALKGKYAISYADCFAAALAQRMRAVVVTGDPEFEQLERDRVIAVEWLPRATSN